MRKMTVIIALAMIVALCGIANAEPRDGIGIGVIVGEPTGLSLKKWIGDDRAMDAGIGWSFSENDSLHLHADYLFHRFDLISDPEMKGKLSPFFGIGARVKLKEENNGKGANDDDALVGVRAPLGLSYLFSDALFEVFAEIVPVLDIAPDTDFALNAAIGARLYF